MSLDEESVRECVIRKSFWLQCILSPFLNSLKIKISCVIFACANFGNYYYWNSIILYYLLVQKNFEFCTTDLIWNAKQKVLIEFASNKDLVDALNFGFYMPPSGGRAGKFLDEQRAFKDYPIDGTTGVLEVRQLTIPKSGTP